MIDTLMVLWNRGHGGRSILVSLAFFLICISISLLLVSLGGPLFSQLEPRGEHKSMVRAADITTTTQPGGIQPMAGNTATVNTSTPTATPNSCDTPVVSKTPAPRGSSIMYNGGKHGKPQPTPTRRPQPTSTPRPTPTPTVTPTSTTPTPTPTATSTPTPTPTVAPTSTPTPVVTPTTTSTPTVTPTATFTPVATPSVTLTVAITRSPRFVTNSPHGGGKPITTGPSSSGQNGNIWHPGCLHTGYSLDLSAGDALMAILERSLWLILGGSTLGTALFYAAVYLLARKRTGEKIPALPRPL